MKELEDKLMDKLQRALDKPSRRLGRFFMTEFDKVDKDGSGTSR